VYVGICERSVLKRVSNNKMRGHGLESGEGQVMESHEPLVPQRVEFLIHPSINSLLWDSALWNNVPGGLWYVSQISTSNNCKVKAKVSQYIMKHYIMKAHGREEVKLLVFISAGLEGSGQLHFTPRETPQYLVARPQRMPGHSEQEETFLIPAGNQTSILWWCIL
jgi:hypothetical protein